MKKVRLVITLSLVVSLVVASVAYAKEKVVVRIGATAYGSGNLSGAAPEELSKRLESFYDDPRGTNAISEITCALTDIMFMYAYPDIRVKKIPFNYFALGDRAEQVLMAAIAEGTAPSVLPVSRDTVYNWAKEGILADITDYVSDAEKWPKLNALPEAFKVPGIINGKVYAIPGCFENDFGVTFRRDYFKEAGIFNKAGEPAPSVNWTMDDLLRICQKLADPKKNRYALTITTYGDWGIIWRSAFGDFRVKPDPTGKYTWRADFDAPGKRHFEFLQKLVKTGSVLYTTEERSKSWANFAGGRTAIHDWQPVQYRIWHQWADRHTHSFLPPGVDFLRDVGGTIFPAGPEGIVPNSVSIGLVGILGTMSKEEIEAALEWIRWATQQDPNPERQAWLLAYWYTSKIKESDPSAPAVAFGTWVIQRPPVYKYNTDIIQVPGLPLSMYELPEIVPEIQDSVDLSNRIRALPMRPNPLPYGAPVPESSIDAKLRPVYELIYSNPDADWGKELAKAEKLVNSTILNYKDKDITKENLKAYYSALADFYKENYPEYYNKYFTNLLEEHYKIW